MLLFDLRKASEPVFPGILEKDAVSVLRWSSKRSSSKRSSSALASRQKESTGDSVVRLHSYSKRNLTSENSSVHIESRGDRVTEGGRSMRMGVVNHGSASFKHDSTKSVNDSDEVVNEPSFASDRFPALQDPIPTGFRASLSLDIADGVRKGQGSSSDTQLSAVRQDIGKESLIDVPSKAKKSPILRRSHYEADFRCDASQRSSGMVDANDAAIGGSGHGAGVANEQKDTRGKNTTQSISGQRESEPHEQISEPSHVTANEEALRLVIRQELKEFREELKEEIREEMRSHIQNLAFDIMKQFHLQQTEFEKSTHEVRRDLSSVKTALVQNPFVA